MDWMAIRKWILVIVLFLFLICPITCEGADITFAWDYPNPPEDLAGFRLHQAEDPNTLIHDLDNAMHIVTVGASNRTVTIYHVGDTNIWYWALTALDVLGNQSDISNIVCYDFINGQPCGIISHPGVANFLRIK